MTAHLILHIGDPKTGTSSIQEVLFKRAFECESMSLDYPELLSAVVLANSLKANKRAGLKEKQFAKYANWLSESRADVAVISAEQFAPVDPELVQQTFQSFMPDQAGDMQVVAYVRPHVSRFVSAYAQRTKDGALFTDIDSFFENQKTENVLNYHTRFMKWQAVFGDRFVLRPMVREALQDGDVVADFLGIALAGAPFRILGETQSNSSLSVEHLSGLRLVQKVLRKFEIANSTRQAVGSRINTLISATGAKGTKLLPSKALYDRIAENCMADAENMDRDFFGKPIMVPALIAAGNDTVQDKMDHTVKAFHAPEAIVALRGHARRLAKMLLDQPGIWDAAFRRARGEVPALRPEEFLSDETQAFIKDVDDSLAELAAMIGNIAIPTTT